MTTLLPQFIFIEPPTFLERLPLKEIAFDTRGTRTKADIPGMVRRVLVDVGNGILFRCADHLDITPRQVQAWSRDTAEVIRSLPTRTTRQARQKMWREVRLRWGNDLRADNGSLSLSTIKILQVFEDSVRDLPKMRPSKHTPSKRAMRNARRLDILRRAIVDADDPYLQAVKSGLGSQRYARILIRPSAPKKGIVEVYRGHPQELRRALELRRTRKIAPMPLP